MSKRSGACRQGLPTAEFYSDVAFGAPSARYALGSAEVRALPFQIAAWVVVILLTLRLDLSALHHAFQDVLLNTAAWDCLFMSIDIDEVMLFAATRPSGVLRAAAQGFGIEAATMLAALVTMVLLVRRTSVLLPVDKRARQLAYELRQACRDISLHYTCDQFWLRIRGR